MKYNAIITDFDFNPMVEIMPSILQISVRIPKLNITIALNDIMGSIDWLSKKFRFTVKGDSYDFGKFIGRHCIIDKREDGFHFVGFDEQ